MKNMNDFNAEKARQIVDSKFSDEFHNILTDIKSEAEKGETVLHIYKPISQQSREGLRNKGFKVVDCPSMATQRDGLYYSIYWSKVSEA